MKPLILLLILFVVPVAYAEKLTEAQFNAKLYAYSSLVKNTNDLIVEAYKKDDSNSVSSFGILSCRKMVLYDDMLKLVKANKHIESAWGYEVIIQDALEQEERLINNAGATRADFCEGVKLLQRSK